MSSIRPLLTITVLAAVGVFLYAKINETEPQLPEGVDDWNVGELDLDMGGIGGSDSMAVAEFNESTARVDSGTAAPTFSPSTTASTTAEPAPAFTAGPAEGAPAWTPPPTQPTPPAEVATAPPLNPTNTPVISQTQGDLPELPPLPPQTVDAVAANVTGDSIPSHVSDPEISAAQTDLQTSSLPSNDMPPITPTKTVSAGAETQTQSSLFSATRLAVQSALDRGELSQALLLLSDWYGDPSLSPSEAAEVDRLLSQLAGSVIYSTEPRLAPPHMVQAGQRLEDIAKQYDVPWQLLAKINGITSADQLQPGQEIKVLRGPFSAMIDMSKKTMTLMLDRRYAGKFMLDIDSNITVEEGHWQVQQKLLTPGNATLPGASPTTLTEERSLMLSSTNGDGKVVVLRGTTSTNPLTEPAGRILRMKPSDAADVFDILSLGSKVVIRR